MVKRTPEFVVQTLIDDEPMCDDFAELVPKVSKILDAAALFISAVGKKQSDEKTAIYGLGAEICNDAVGIAQQIVKEAAAINQLFRAPNMSNNSLEANSQQKMTVELSASDGEQTVSTGQMSEDDLIDAFNSASVAGGSNGR